MYSEYMNMINEENYEINVTVDRLWVKKSSQGFDFKTTFP